MTDDTDPADGAVLRLALVPPRPSDRVGLLDRYVEETYAAGTGPTAVLLVRRLARLATPGGTELLHTAQLAASLGVNSRRLTTALDRLVAWHLVTRVPGGIAVTGLAPLLTDAQLARLPTVTAAAHRQFRPPPR
jgi:hypothetical protein